MQIIDIPTYNLPKTKYFFNPSIFRVGQSYRMAYRANMEDGTPKIGMCKLTQEFQPEKNSGFYITPPKVRKTNDVENAEDARVQYINGRLSMSYVAISPFSEWRNLGFCYLDRSMQPEESYFFRYGATDNSAAVECEQWASPAVGTVLTRHMEPNIEKNWQFFTHLGELHFVYSTEPHIVVRPNLTTLEPDKVYETNYPLPWKYGQPRGGTPPVLIGDEFFSFFHSHTVTTPEVSKLTGCGKQYHFAAYAFSAKPPFHITRFASAPLISGDPYDNVVLWGNAAAFPCGALLVGDEWAVSYGYNDREMKILKIKHSDVLASLTKLTDV